MSIPTQVNFVGKGANLYELGYELDGSIQVINNFLQTTWLWEKIRVQGGAYGGQSAFDIHSGIFTFLSYRDPNLLESLEIYDETPQFLAELELPKSELTKSIIGTIGDLDSYLLPDAKGWTSLSRNLVGYDDDRRQKIRDEVLSTSLDHFKSFGRLLEKIADHGSVVVLGSTEALTKANIKKPDYLVIKKVM